ncbi:MFS transporter [Methylobacterium sp. JK268]
MDASRATTGGVETGSRTIPARGIVSLLGLAIFGVTTSEFMVAGMMPDLTAALGASVAAIGDLISLYALGMALGGPLLTILFLRFGTPDKAALVVLLALSAAGAVVCALAPGYAIMAAVRVGMGAAASACFGVALTIAAGLVAPQERGRAASIVLAGLTLSPVLGLPVTTALAQHLGWRASFWSVALLALACTVLVAAAVPETRRGGGSGLGAELPALRSTRLWAAYATSGLVIGATFAAFSYAAPLLIEVAGLPASLLPGVLAAYGGANVLGNLVVGRLADRHTIPVLAGGLALLAAALAAFALFAGSLPVAVAAFLVIGLSGVTLNPALVARVMRAASPGTLVNTLHAAVITAGLAFGTWAGGRAIAAGYGLTAPLWVGLVLALLGLVSLAPRRLRETAPT